MTLRARARLALVVVVVAFLLLGGLVLGMVRDAGVVRHQTTGVLYPAGEQVSELLIATNDMERGVAGFVITEDPAFLTSYIAGRAQADQAYEELRGLLADGSSDLLPLLDQAAADYQDWLDAVVAPILGQVASGNAAAARQAITSGAGRREFGHVRADLALLDQALDARMAASVEHLSEINRRLSIALLVTALALVLATAAASTAMVRWVIHPLDDLRAQMRRIARANDTTSPLHPGGPPEIAALGRDSELLRQHLVSQIDAADEALEGLEQEGPAVATLRSLLRGPAAPEVPGFGIGVASVASQGALTGDWWDVITLVDADGVRRTAVEVCDIAGHDAVAGVIASRFKAALHVGLRNGVPAPAAVSQAAAIFTKTPGTFASYVVVEFDPDELRVLNAGHNPPLLLRRSGAVDMIHGTGPLVTSMPGARWRQERIAVESGDVLVLYTDGLVEARDDGDAEVGEEQVLAWCRQLCAESAMDPTEQRAGYIAHGLMDRARESAIDLRRDDVTVIVAVRA